MRTVYRVQTAQTFLSTLREEGDPTSISGPTLHQVISIHASARRATGIVTCSPAF